MASSTTLLNEPGFNSDWIEKYLAHEDERSSRGVYNKAKYEVQGRYLSTLDAALPWRGHL